MVKQEDKMKKWMRVCRSCGILRNDCKRDQLEGLWICATCSDGAMPISPACQEKTHKSCKVEACYCDCHPENNEMGNDRPTTR